MKIIDLFKKTSTDVDAKKVVDIEVDCNSHISKINLFFPKDSFWSEPFIEGITETQIIYCFMKKDNHE